MTRIIMVGCGGKMGQVISGIVEADEDAQIVVVEELIPETSRGEHSNVGTISFAVGFVLMMMLDVALG